MNQISISQSMHEVPPRVRWWQWLLSRRAREYVRRERAALPDGTLVRLICCGSGCSFLDHGGVWRTSWSPRRTGILDDPDDYLLERVGDGETTFATRAAIEPVPEDIAELRREIVKRRTPGGKS